MAVCTAQETGSPRFVWKKSKIPASAFEQYSCRLQLASLWYYSSPSSRILCTYQTSDTFYWLVSQTHVKHISCSNCNVTSHVYHDGTAAHSNWTWWICHTKMIYHYC